MAEYRVFLRDVSYAIVGELTDWVKLSVIPRVNDVGTWALEVRLDNPSIVQGLLLKTGGIVVKRDGVTVLSGPVFTQYTRTATTLKVAGVCDNILLAARQILPNYNVAPSLYTDEYEVITGQASTVIQTLVSRNLGPLARTAPYSRRVTALTIPTDPLIGGTVTVRGRFGTSVIAALANLAVSETAGGLRFWIAQSDSVAATLVLNIAEARDQTDAARFGIEQQTAVDVEDDYRAPGANYFFAGAGDGLGADRTIYEDFNGISILETGILLETFVDVRQTGDSGEMAQRLAELVAGAVSSRRLTVTPIEGGSTAYGTAWDIGDLVTAVVNGVSITKVIREIEVRLDPGSGAVVTPMLGDAGASNDSDTAEGRMAAYINAVDVRLGKIEGHFNIPDDSLTNAMLHPYMKWTVGDYKQSATAAVQPGWLLCNGQQVSQTTYADLYAVVGATFNTGGETAGNFRVPDRTGRVSVGSGTSYALNATGGSATAPYSVPNHSHAHSHGGGTLAYAHTHASQAHTHPGSHSHGISSHYHGYNISHDHGTFSSGDRNNTTPGGAFRWDEPNVSSGTEDHHHAVDVPNYSVSNFTSEIGKDGGGTDLTSTGPDSNAPAASYTGSPSGVSGGTWTGGSDPDSTSSGGASGSVSTIQPYVVDHWLIFAGA